MMDELLDNPVYHATVSGNKNLSLGTSTVRYFPAAIAPFVGLADFSEARFSELAEVLPPKRGAVVVSADEIIVPTAWKVNYHGVGLQMMGEHAIGPALEDWEFVPLQQKHVPLMVELATLTNPGPFGARTIEFGGFVGVFDGGRLIGMSGHRLHPSPYIEVSGVCTHPDHVGRGLGAALTYYQVESIRAMGQLPMLHVWAYNVRAIRLYENLGFITRRQLHFNMIELVV
ncbi:MAG TPA: GNAT family N-acetyltransferase [Puia sp.]|jgi:ribosomal protein S18 acetylase RimI-like enzyme|nr:GNAT family N-acetyltransferase [Puia sp.]